MHLIKHLTDVEIVVMISMCSFCVIFPRLCRQFFGSSGAYKKFAYLGVVTVLAIVSFYGTYWAFICGLLCLRIGINIEKTRK